MKSHRIAAFAGALFAITLASLPRNAVALQRKAGGSQLPYMQYASGSTLTEVVVSVLESVSSTVL